jgi:hypothetical protein
MIVSKANLANRFKRFVRKEPFETGGLVSVIAQRAVDLSKTMVGAIERCKQKKFGWNGAEMGSMKFINLLRDCVLTFVRGAFEPVENDPRASTGKFEFPYLYVFGTRLHRAPSEDVVAWFKEFGI